MKMLKNILGVVLLSTMWMVVVPTMNVMAEGYSNALVVEDIIAYGGSNMLVVSTSGGSVYTTGCVANSWVITSSDTQLLDRVYSTLLTAMTTNRKIKFWYKDVCGAWNYHVSENVRIYK